MGRKAERHQVAADRAVKDIRRKTRNRYSSEEKIRIVLAGLRGEDSIAELCRVIAERCFTSMKVSLKAYITVGQVGGAVFDSGSSSQRERNAMLEACLRHDQAIQPARPTPAKSRTFDVKHVI